MKTLMISFSDRLFLLGVTCLLVGCEGGETRQGQTVNDARLSEDATQVSDVGTGSMNAADQGAHTSAINSVGYRTTDLTYTPPDGTRTLPVYFWYPSSATEGTAARYNGFLASEAAFQDVPPIEGTVFPVLLFSHGKRGMGAATSAFMLEHFARNGWFVVAWEHTGDTTFNADDIGLTYLHRPLDIHAVLDFIFDPNAQHGFAGKLEDRVLLSGHSRGGYGSLAVAGAQYDIESADANCLPDNTSEYCQAYRAFPDQFEAGFLDDRVHGLILLASGDYARFNDGVNAVSIPVLQWTADGDRNNSNEDDGDPIWNALAGESFRFNIANGGHFTFTSICSIVGPLGVDNGCDSDNYPLPEAHALINRYALQFGNAFMRDVQADEVALSNLTTEAVADPNVSFSQKAPE